MKRFIQRNRGELAFFAFALALIAVLLFGLRKLDDACEQRSGCPSGMTPRWNSHTGCVCVWVPR